ncbi:hypothetical protein ACQ4PT_005023 [Festuca glaucescens]
MQGSGNFSSGGGAASGAPPGAGQNAQSGFQRSSTYERGSGTGYGNGRGGGQGYGQYGQQNLNSGNFRGPQGMPPPNGRNFNSAQGGFNQGQYGGGGGNGWQQNNGWADDQNMYGQSDFSGEFGDFNEGYYDAGQNYGQNNGFNGAQRFRRPIQNNGQYIRPRGGRSSRGRGRGFGGTFPQNEQQGSEGAVVNTQSSQPHAIAITPVQQTVETQVVDQVQQNNIVAVVTAAVESVGQDLAKLNKKKDKFEDTICFRCDDLGHLAIDCVAVLCLCCDSAKHATADYHLHAMPKPVAQMYGLCNDALLFFDIPKSAGVKSKRHSGKEGHIRVSGGTLSSHQVVKELSFLVPGKHQCDITKIDENIFKVVYPTKADCARLRKINDIKVDDSDCKLFSEDWVTQKVSPIKFGSFLWDGYVDGNRCSSSVPVGSSSAPVLGSKVLREPCISHKSAGHVFELNPKKSWGAQVEEDVEEDLPSPLHCMVARPGPQVVTEVVPSASASMLQCSTVEVNFSAAADLLPLFAAAAEERVLGDEAMVQDSASSLASVVSVDGPGVGEGKMEVSPRQEAMAARSDPEEVVTLPMVCF